MFSFKKKIIFLLIFGILFLQIPSLSSAAWTNTVIFNVDPNYDSIGRSQIETQLIKTTNNFYFYADKDWYEKIADKNQLDNQLYNLTNDFEYKTYPALTNLLGSEDNPGIDNDSRIIIVLEPLKDNFGGYVQAGDQYAKSLYKNSNEGQIIYLNSNLIAKVDQDFLDYELAHEFTHLITLRQKPNAEVWFYELMSEFAGQIIGVDITQITKQRAQNLLYSTEVNLENWTNSDKDYGKVFLFALYLKEQFGNQFLAEALKYSSNDGVISFNGAFKQLGINKTFDDVYLSWLITNLVNNCQVNTQYCYKNPALSSFQTIPYTYYLPTQSNSSLSVTDSLKTWTGKWQKIIGGQGILQLKFTIPEQTSIQTMPYVIEDNTGKKIVGLLDFSSINTQELYVDNMGTTNVAVYFVPFIGLSGQEGKTYYYSWKATNLDSSSQTDKQIIDALLKRIDELKKEVASLQLQLAMLQTNHGNSSCSVFPADLYYGMNSNQVKCLQQFLVNLGENIYPEKLITGYFGPLTQAAVKRYQALKGIITTGYFGPLTRAKINSELTN
jgi:peptidoglycan hydrolase-like protein with peptidoglycan-binding domain